MSLTIMWGGGLAVYTTAYEINQDMEVSSSNIKWAEGYLTSYAATYLNTTPRPTQICNLNIQHPLFQGFQH
jgi:hypothetical protein